MPPLHRDAEMLTARTSSSTNNSSSSNSNRNNHNSNNSKGFLTDPFACSGSSNHQSASGAHVVTPEGFKESSAPNTMAFFPPSAEPEHDNNNDDSSTDSMSTVIYTATAALEEEEESAALLPRSEPSLSSKACTTTTRCQANCKPNSLRSTPTTGHPNSYRRLQCWCLVVVVVSGAVAWFLTHRILAVFWGAFSLPLLIMTQGSVAILRYRIKYGRGPIPQAPSHGIVRATDRFRSNPPNQTEELLEPEANADPSQQTPLRLLVIGDSLAVGVGQSSSATPVMPEVIAQSLSKDLGGRPVLWTCHGAPGASAGWIVRELERSLQRGQFLHHNDKDAHHHHPSTRAKVKVNINLDLEGVATGSSGLVRDHSHSETDSSSDESDSSWEHSQRGQHEHDNDNDLDGETESWQERLRKERIQFDPNTLGPFDIAVVMTGSNDIKSAFFPFMLTGEDFEFRRQAQQRGGSYGNELARILEVLNQGMRVRLETLRESVEEATQRMRERLSSCDGVVQVQYASDHPTHRSSTTARTLQRKNSRVKPDRSSGRAVSSPSHREPGWIEEKPVLEDRRPQMPLIVLPGMPARSLPIFSSAPLRWLAIPTVTVMDSYKRRLANKHKGEVLFVEAPSIDQINEYLEKKGDCWEGEQGDQVLLKLRDIKRRHARRIEADMHEHYSKAPNAVEDPLKPRSHFDLISVDGIHPTDQGYRFWGRHIAHQIGREWTRKDRCFIGASPEVV